MKKTIGTVILSAALVCGVSGIVAYNEASTVKAEGSENYAKTVVTIRNNTPFELENVNADFGVPDAVKTECIKPYSEITVQVPENIKNTTMLKVNGTTGEGKEFAGCFSGWLADDTLVTVQFDEECNFSIFSNISEN